MIHTLSIAKTKLPIGLCLLILALSISGCKKPIDCSGEDVVFERYTLGEWLIDVDSGTGSWQLRHQTDAAPLASSTVCNGTTLQSPVSTATGKPLVINFTGSFRNLPKAMDKLNWRTINAEQPDIIYDQDSLNITWALTDKTSAGITFKLHDKGNLWLGVVNGNDASSAAEIRLDCSHDEAFYGLGAQSTGMNLRGRRYPLWTQEQGVGKVDNDLTWPLTNRREATYAPMGVWHSSVGYSAVIGHDSYSDIDLCSTDAGFKLRSYQLPPSFVFVKGNSVKERLTEVTAYVGRLQETPPDWVFAPWNDAAAGPAWLAETAKRLREHDIPSSVLWAEDWAGGEDTPLILKLTFNWEWDPNRYPNLPNTIDELHQKGFAFLAYYNPFVSKKGDNWTYGDQNGLFIKNSQGETKTFIDYFMSPSTLLDLTNPSTLSWLKESQLRAVEETGIDGWMADFAEWLPTNAYLHSGENAWVAHNRYPLMWQAANRDALAQARPDNNWTFFVRSGWASIHGGSPGITPLLWAGDQNTNWTEGDGLPSVIPIGIHAGLAGVPLFGSDIGGYMSLPPVVPHTTKELFFRWASLGAFTPLMRTHHGNTNCGNWMFSSDEETIAHYRRYSKIHSLMLPFFKGLTKEAQQFGWPVMRHPYLADEQNESLWRTNESLYFLGDNVLVAPIVKRGSEQRELNLPAGEWWPLLGNQGFNNEANSALSINATPSEIPVFVKAGTMIPLLGEVVDSFYGIDAQYGTDLRAVEGRYRLALYPDLNGNLNPLHLNNTTVSGEGWSIPSVNVDWSQARWNGTALPACTDQSTDHCFFSTGVFLRNVVDGRLTINSAELTFHRAQAQDSLETGEDAEPQEWKVQIARDAWGELADTTPYTPSRTRIDNCEAFSQ